MKRGSLKNTHKHMDSRTRDNSFLSARLTALLGLPSYGSSVGIHVESEKNRVPHGFSLETSPLPRETHLNGPQNDLWETPKSVCKMDNSIFLSGLTSQATSQMLMTPSNSSRHNPKLSATAVGSRCYRAQCRLEQCLAPMPKRLEKTETPLSRVEPIPAAHEVCIATCPL